MDLLDTHVYFVIGEDGFTRLVAAFYRRVATDDILRPMYPEHDLAGAERRLRDFLIQRFGGPSVYSEHRGHPRLRMRHVPFVIDANQHDRWLHHMRAALVELAPPPDVSADMDRYFVMAAESMRNRA